MKLYHRMNILFTGFMDTEMSSCTLSQHLRLQQWIVYNHFQKKSLTHNSDTMAAAAPLTDALNASPDQLTSMFKQHDQEDPDIEAHFTAKELSAMSDYEKKRLRNVKRNFLVMSALGKQFCYLVL